jgi:Mrp family chromosome partitioning ATPase
MRSKVAFNKLFLLEEPVLNTDNVSTNKAKQLATMIMIFILGVVAIYGLHDYLRGSILSKHQITDNKGHIYLGAIGHIKNFESVNLVLKSRQNDTIMRMSYQLKKRGDQGQTDNGRVITISSSFPMSGKSFTSLALGVGLSARGQSTCIIDCDFRAKSRNVRKYSTQKNQTVRSYQNVHELLIKTCVSDEKFNFCISPLLDNDVAIEEAQSFLNEEFAAIIDQLKTKFDYVILDSPPLNFPEALILAELATSIVICLPEGEMTRRQFDQTLESIEPHRRPNTKIFTVLTNCRFNEDHPNRHYRQYQEQNVA